MLTLKETILIKYIIKEDLFDIIFKLYQEEYKRNNLQISVIIGIFESIAKENNKELINYIVIFFFNFKISRYKQIKEKKIHQKNFEKIIFIFEKN